MAKKRFLASVFSVGRCIRNLAWIGIDEKLESLDGSVVGEIGFRVSKVLNQFDGLDSAKSDRHKIGRKNGPRTTRAPR